MMRAAWLPIGAATLALIMGCGDQVVVDASSTTSTTSTSSGTTSTTTTTGTGGAPAAKICGGDQALPCGPDEWCQWDSPNACGAAGATGVCEPKPTTCTDECGFVAVCGCDGNSYCNACDAHKAGVDVTTDTAVCAAPPPPVDPEYGAYLLPVTEARYVITKAEHAADRCVFVYMAGWPTDAFDVQVTAGWSAQWIYVSPHAQDCAMGIGKLWQPPDAVPAAAATGSIVHDGDGWPCAIDLDLTITWPPGSPAWVPAEDTLQTTGLTVEGTACGG